MAKVTRKMRDEIESVLCKYYGAIEEGGHAGAYSIMEISYEDGVSGYRIDHLDVFGQYTLLKTSIKYPGKLYVVVNFIPDFHKNADEGAQKGQIFYPEPGCTQNEAEWQFRVNKKNGYRNSTASGWGAWSSGEFSGEWEKWRDEIMEEK